MDRAQLAFFGLFFCTFIFGFDAWLGWSVVRQWRASSYAATTGTVTHSEAIRTYGRGGGWRADVRYSYVVAGQSYTATRLRYDPENANVVPDTVAKYPPQSTVTVYYNPTSPGDAVLELGVYYTTVAGAALLSAPFNAIALVFVAGVFDWLMCHWSGPPIARAWVRHNRLQTRIRFYETSPGTTALLGFGIASFFSIFAVAILCLLLPLSIGIAIAWSATFAATAIVWWRFPQEHVELRHDKVRGTVEVRRWNGTYSLSLSSVLESVVPNHREPKDGTPLRFPLRLRFVDVDQRRRLLKLPAAATKAEAAEIVQWLNRLLGLPSNP